MANGQLWEIDSQGNKKQISGMVTGELPKYTMAEYTALTDKPIDWICTDYDATSEYGINDTEVKHGNTTVNNILNTKVVDKYLIQSNGSLSFSFNGESCLVALNRQSGSLNTLLSFDYWSNTYVALVGSVPTGITFSKTALSTDITMTSTLGYAVSVIVI